MREKGDVVGDVCLCLVVVLLVVRPPPREEAGLPPRGEVHIARVWCCVSVHTYALSGFQTQTN